MFKSHLQHKYLSLEPGSLFRICIAESLAQALALEALGGLEGAH
jgi:hypothetical protein